MKRFSEQLNTKSKSIKIDASEKRELRERVVSYMEYHPLPKSMEGERAIPTPFYTEPFKKVTLNFNTLARWSGALAAIVLLVVPVLAERAVPGDGLYAVKGFTEDVRGTLNFTPYQKIEWETERLNRRIAEARLLADEGRLTDEVEAEVAQAVKFHTENAQREIEALRYEDADEATLATIALSTTLQVQSASLREENGDTEIYGEDKKTTRLLANVIDETLSKQEANNASSTVPSYEKMMARVELNTTRAYELLASLGLSNEDEQYKEITRRIEDIGRSVEEAITLHEADDQKAREILIDSLQRTQRLVVLMTQIEVSEDFDVEGIVPVVFTSEEKANKTEQYKQDLDKQVKIIEASIVIQTNTDITGKAENSLASLKESQLKIASSTDFAEIKKLSEEALTLAGETVYLLEQNTQAKATTTPVTTDTISEESADNTKPKVE